MKFEQAGAQNDVPFKGGGEMGAMIRAHNWSGTPLGSPSGWSMPLRTLVDVLLGSAQPMFLVWGADRTLLYNDAYSEILGNKHPAALGRNLLDVWHEIRDDLLPIVEQVLRGEPVRNDDIELWMERKGYREETHFAFSYTPVHGDNGGIEGFFCVCQEITGQIVTGRQLRDSEARLKAVINGIGEGFMLLDRDFRIVEVNTEALRLDIRGREAIVGYSHWEVYPATQHSELGRLYKLAMAERVPVSLEHQYQWENGRVGWYDMRAYPINDGLAVFYRDVTEKKRAQEESAARAAEHATILSQIADGVIVADREGRITFVNEAAERLHGVKMLGISPEEYSESYHLLTEAGEPYPSHQLPLARAVLNGESVVDARWRIRRSDGTEVLAIGSAKPILDGEQIGAVLTVRDETERMQAERELRRNEARLRFLSELDEALRQTPDAAHAMMAAAELLGSSLRVSRCAYASVEADNDSFTILEDYTAPDVASSAGRYSLELFGPRAAANMRGGATLTIRHVSDELAAGEGRETFQAIDIEAIVCCPLIKDGRLVAMMAVHQNVPRAWTSDDIDLIQTVVERCWAHVERVSAEARLREETRTLETLNTVGKALVGELDLERLVQMVTDASVELIGADYGAFFYNVENSGGEALMLYTLSGANRSDFEQFGMPGLTEVFAPTFSAHQVVRSEDILADPRFGKNAPHNGLPKGHLPVRSYLAVPVLSRSGGAIGGLFFAHKETGRFTERHERLVLGLAAQGAVAIDNARLFQNAHQELEERRKVENRLRELNETLEQRVAREVAERSKAEEALRQAQKMEAVGQLTGGIAHDFNNLLTIVTGNIDMAGRALSASGNPDARTQRALDNALKGAERAAALTQRLLAFSRRQPLAPKALDADRLVSGMSDLLQRALGERVKLEVVTSPGLWRVEADPNQLESAILNLAVNARDAMPDGGTLTVETANARLDEAYAAEHAEVAPGHYVVIAASDTGIGMTKETVARVFEPFFTTKDVGKGTGLGLSMVYGFTKQSGGHIKIYSEPGHGTTVKIYLPRLLSDVRVEDVVTEEGLEVSRAQELILVVEDDDDVRSYTVECLRELGYRVREAHDGEAALRIFESDGGEIDLLFTDVVMPGMTGRELADRVRQSHPQVKILFTSGYTRDAITHGGRLDGGVEMISKPFTYTSLARKIADVLDKGQTGRVLLVEQDATVRMFAAEGLTSGGYQVDEASNPAEALARVRAARGRYDAVLLDEQLAGQSGEMVAAELRKLHADLPILLASNDPNRLARGFTGDRCTDVIGKPYNAAKLLKALDLLGVRCRTKAEGTANDSD
jgi:PAS domain S-box-containing protein